MWSATCCSVAFGARARHAFTESAIAAESVPAARRARARGSRLSSYTRTASETKAGLKFTMTMPPFAGTSRRIESGTSREWSASARADRSEEHTSELQSRLHLVCRLLLEKKKKKRKKDSMYRVHIEE